MPADSEQISKMESSHPPSRGRITSTTHRVIPALVGAGILALSALVIAAVVVQGYTVSSQSEQLEALATSTDSLREQVIKSGEVPVAGPSETITGVPGPQGAPGLPGLNGRNGFPGIDGLDGKDGAQGSPGLDGSAGTTGTTGEPGADGVDGTKGAPGVNGINGTNGAAGAPGAPGINGTNGTNGEPPSSWSYPNGSTCSREVPFDPDSPTYTCTPPTPVNNR